MAKVDIAPTIAFGADRAQKEKNYTAKPRHEWVLIRPLKATATLLEGGLVTPENETSTKQRGIVEAIGPDVKPDIKIGDLVVCTAFPMDVNLGKTELALMRDEEIYAILVEDES